MSFVQTEFHSGVFSITLNRPEKRNALRRDFIREIQDAVDSAKATTDTRILVFQAKGSVFCAGMDLGEMQDRATSEQAADEYKIDSEVYCNLLTSILDLEIPTVAALQGPVLAGGVGLVLACDLMIAAENTFFALPEPARGITAAMVTPLLIYRIGAGPANFMLLSQERVTAKKAAEFGLCHDVVRETDLDERLDQLCKSILAGSKSALSITKEHLREVAGKSLAEQVRYSINVSARARETTDAREGLAAFLEKRKPVWQQALQ